MTQSESVKVEATELSPSVRSLTVEVEAARVDKAFDRSYGELSRKVQVKGFRPGKVPRSIVQKMYAGAVAEELEQQLVSETLADAVELSELQPLCEPEIEAEKPEPGQVFRYTARIEVRPPIELPDLSSLTGKRVAVEVTDDDLTSELETLRQRHARLVEEPDETEAAEGHILSVDFVGRVDGEAFEGGTGQDVEVELGSERLVSGFEDQLVGAKAEDDVEVTITFPEDYSAENLRGREAVFQVHVAAVRRREFPELDDEFAKDVGNFESLDELRDKIRDDLTSSRVEQSAEGVKRSVLDSLIASTDFEVPPGVVERELHGQISSMQRRFKGAVPDEVLQSQLARMHEEGRPNAERRVRESFLLATVAEAQEIEIGDDDVDRRLDELAEAQGMDSEKMRGMADQQGWRDAIRAELTDQRALDFLVSEATVEEIAESESQDSEA